jgi:2',3'-cyclic-nucleotide 2'-phosphodiesterase (5'-nucleotidase family)
MRGKYGLMKPAALLVAVAVAACSQPAKPERRAPPQQPQPKPGAVTLTIIGTNDLHGALERLPIFGGFVANVRAARAADGGGVLLLDGGDMFQGTLESNISEGADVVRAYNQLGYTATAVGNHEFDYGPVGPAVTAASVEDDARGALKARASEAKFPLVVSNVVDKASGARIKWPNMPASTLVEVAGVKVGVIGASTEATPYTTMPANFADLAIAPPARAIADEAKRLREQGAQMIGDLPKGLVDVIVAGHTHAGIAHRISDIAVIESFSSGRAFGRIDLRISPDGHVTSSKIYPPQPTCPGDKDGARIAPADCKPGDYEGKPVVPDAAVQKIVDDALAKAGVRRAEKLGVTLAKTITRAHGTESAEGNWFCDLMLAARPEAQVSLVNGGGLRADIPAGELTYGQLFEGMPFDNRFAVVEVKGSHLRGMVSANLQRGGGILSFGGLTAKARCKGNQLDLQITVGGKPLSDTASYKIVTSDFLASGGDGLFGRLNLPESAIKMTDTIIRDAIADVLRKRKGTTIDADQLFSPTRRRLDYEGSRPVRCGAPPDKGAPEEPAE